MGRVNQDIPYKGPVGLNQAISPFQADRQGAMTANNVYFKRWGEYSSIHKRKGRTRMNAAAASDSIDALYQFEFGGTRYLHSYSADGQLDSVNVGTGVLTFMESDFSTTESPDFELIGGKAFYTAPTQTETVYQTANAIAGWSNVTGNCDTFVDDGDFFYDHLNAGDASGCGMRKSDIATHDFTHDYLIVRIGYYNDENQFDSFEENIIVGSATDYQGNVLTDHIAFKVTAYSDAGIVNWNQYTVRYDNEGRDICKAADNGAYTTITGVPSMQYIEVKINLNKDTTSNTGGAFDVSGVTGIMINGITMANTNPRIYVTDFEYVPIPNNLCYCVDSTGFRTVYGENLPLAPTSLSLFDGRLWAALDNTLYYSTPNDGTDWTTDSANFAIDDGDGDTIEAIRTLGQDLIVFKKYSIHRIKITGNADIPYRRVAVYTGDATQIGIGCSARKTIQNVALGSGNELLGSLEYLVFASEMGIYAIGLTGGPIKIDKRVRQIWDSIRPDKRANLFSVVHPQKQQYWMAYPTAGDVEGQLIYGIETKEWSNHDFSDITSLISYISDDRTYIIMGNKDGYLFKHDYQLDNPQIINDCNVTTGWTKTNGIDFTTNEINKMWESASLSYGKDSTNESYVQLERNITATDLDDTTFYTWMYMPPVTGGNPAVNDGQFNSVFVTLGQNAANDETWWLTTDANGDDFKTGWNLIKVDTSTVGDDVDGVPNLAACILVKFQINHSVGTMTYEGFLVDKIYHTEEDANDYRDAINAGTFEAINARWRLHLNDYGLTERYKQCFSTSFTTQTRGWPNTLDVNIFNEDGEYATTTVDVLSPNEWYNYRLDTGLYGKYLSHEFQNNVSAESMDIYMWSTEIKGMGATN